MNLTLVAVTIMAPLTIMPVAASALLETTAACELMTLEDVTALFQSPASLGGGTADLPNLEDCYWNTEGDGRLYVKRLAAELFTPSGRTAAIQFDDDVKLIKDSVKLEMVGGIGERAAIYPNPENKTVWHVMMVVNGTYVSMTVTAGDHDRIVKAMKAAASRT